MIQGNLATNALLSLRTIMDKYVESDAQKEIPKTCFPKYIGQFSLKCNAHEPTALIRETFHQAITELFNQQIDLKELDIFEIGSGKVKFNDITWENESFLSRVLHHRSWMLSDLCYCEDSYVHSEFDLLYVSHEKYEYSLYSNSIEFDCVAGCNVLDTLPYDKLTDAFQNISQKLKRKGIFIHFADLPFFGNSFFDALAKDETESIFLPSNKLKNSIYKINRLEFFRILEQKKNYLRLNEFYAFNYWGNQKKLAQLLSAFEFSVKKISGTNDLIERIKEIFSSHLKEIFIHDVFVENLEKAAKIRGFEIEICKFALTTVEQTLPKNAEFNYHTMNQIYEQSFKCYALATNKMILKVEAHIFAARKM